MLFFTIRKNNQSCFYMPGKEYSFRAFSFFYQVLETSVLGKTF
jgi:hypothetical protein